MRRLLIAAVAAGLSLPAAAAELAFRIDEGRNINAFVRDGTVAAHLLLRSGTDARILAAFPAGNSGTGLWFTRGAPVRWTLTRLPAPITVADAHVRLLNGFVAEAEVDAATLDVRQAVLSSVRVLRDYEALGKAPPEVLTPPVVTGNRIVWERDRLDGAAGYRLEVEVLNGKVSGGAAPRLTGTGGKLRLRIIALTGETPLVPLTADALLGKAAGSDPRARQGLEFLSYRDKLLAGSWRFDTYFGRDTLMSLRLLMPVLQPQAAEDGLASVLARLAADGEVAHEEDIGEYAVIHNAREGRGRSATPVYDYKMVDDDFMLAPVAAHWLLDTPAGRAPAAAFLAARNAGGTTNGDALARNFRWAVARTAAFADRPVAANLIGLKDGPTGNWRDSNEGLGRGRYAFDINAVFVPAALRAIARFADSGLLAPYLGQASLAAAAPQADAWARAAPPLFAVTLPAPAARAAIGTYARAVGVDPAPALASVTGPLRFDALSLDAGGRPVPVVNSDEGFALLFGDLAPDAVARSVETVMRPFPAGLLTGAGVVVANPAFADTGTQARFGRDAYHGTVVWSWQQAVLAAGLDRQLARTDLPPAVRAQLVTARADLWRVIGAAAAVRSSELWTWSFARGRYSVEPFGANAKDADESNAVQLWSTVFLALNAP